MTSETRVDVLAVLADIWHRGLCSENVNNFEASRAAVAELIDSVKSMRVVKVPHADGGQRLNVVLTPDIERVYAALSRLTGAA